MGKVVMWGAQSTPLVKIGLTDLPKHPAHPSPTPLPIVAHSMAIVNLNKVEEFIIKLSNSDFY